MQEKHMRFGDYIKRKRISDTREITLSDMSKKLGISLSLLSDIENNRRKPFDAEKIEIFASYLEITDGAEKAKLYDLAARDRREVPWDIEDIMMYEEIGNMARFALRESKAGNASEADWKQFIRAIEEKKQRKEHGE